RQRAAAGRYPAQWLDRSRIGRAAGTEWRIRLCHQRGQHGLRASRQGRANQRWRSADRFRPAGQRGGRRRRAVQAAARHACHDPQGQSGPGSISSASTAGGDPMNISAPFIQRPIATALLMVGLLVGGLAAYPLLPVAALPNVNYPTLQVTAQLPGADPQTMASSVATPLELQFGQIPGLTQMTSASALGYTQITLQFDLSRAIDGTVSDTLSAINAAAAQLPLNMPYPPMIRKVNPADTPILVLGLTSDTLPPTTVDAFAENILLQKISQISGVGLVGIGGQQKPAVRVQLDPEALAARGINLEDVRTALGQANVDLPKGTLNSPRQTYTLNTNDQLLKADDYANLVIAYRNGAPVRVRDVGRAISAPENELIAGWYNQQRAVILAIQRQPGANVIETVDRIKAMMPVLQASIPPAVKVNIISDRTETIRAS